jgi:hypothetical protein
VRRCESRWRGARNPAECCCSGFVGGVAGGCRQPAGRGVSRWLALAEPGDHPLVAHTGRLRRRSTAESCLTLTLAAGGAGGRCSGIMPLAFRGLLRCGCISSCCQPSERGVDQGFSLVHRNMRLRSASSGATSGTCSVEGGGMSRKPTLVGSRTFALKKDAEEACRTILYRYRPGERVVDPADERFLLDLLELHPERDSKIGCGIASFEVRSNPRFVKQRSFYLIRTDGSETDFSFVKCLTPPTHRQLVLAAMRQEIFPQIFEFADRAYGSASELPCAITGSMVSRDAAHVDHSAPTFIELAQEFVAEHGGWDEFGISRSDGSIGVQLENSDLAKSWREHHRANCRLRIVSVEANLSLLRRGVKRNA